MSEPNTELLSHLTAVRAGVYAALEMHIRRSEELAGECAKIDEEINLAKGSSQT